MATKKPIIAVDIDDVLADNAWGFVDFSNKRWGTNLTVDDYDEHWGKMWQINNEEEVARRAIEFHQSGSIGRYKHREEAKPVLEELAKTYTLIIITSRREMVTKETFAWLDMHYKDIFKSVYFAGFYDQKKWAWNHTKADLAKEVGASYLLDDQLKHCLGAAEVGIEALLFGDYKWNRTDEPLPKGVTRVSDWQAVQEYFDGRRP